MRKNRIQKDITINKSHINKQINKMTNTIKIKDLQEKIQNVFNCGYEKTIELKINGEIYTIEKD